MTLLAALDKAERLLRDRERTLKYVRGAGGHAVVREAEIDVQSAAALCMAAAARALVTTQHGD